MYVLHTTRMVHGNLLIFLYIAKEINKGKQTQSLARLPLNRLHTSAPFHFLVHACSGHEVDQCGSQKIQLLHLQTVVQFELPHFSLPRNNRER